MGLARHHPGGQWRLCFSATAASAVLYCTIVLFGVGSASPSALDALRDPQASAVPILPQADTETVPGSALRLPQASPEPGRHRVRLRLTRPSTGVQAKETPTPTSSAASPAEISTRRPPSRQAQSAPAHKGPSTATVAQTETVVSLPVTVPTVTVPLPELPVPFPDLPASPLPLPLPLALP
jgi:hypothetical protein